jgi:hypothetical protein
MYTSAPWTSGLLSDALPNTSERYRRSYCFSLHSKYCGQALQSAKQNIAIGPAKQIHYGQTLIGLQAVLSP